MTKAGYILALLLVPSTAQAGSRQGAKVLLSDNPEARKIEVQVGFADAVVSGDTIYLSGVVAGLRPLRLICRSRTTARSSGSARFWNEPGRAGTMSSISPASTPNSRSKCWRSSQ